MGLRADRLVLNFNSGSQHRQAPVNGSEYAYAYRKQQGYEDPCCAHNADNAFLRVDHGLKKFLIKVSRNLWQKIRAMSSL